MLFSRMRRTCKYLKTPGAAATLVAQHGPALASIRFLSAGKHFRARYLCRSRYETNLCLGLCCGDDCRGTGDPSGADGDGGWESADVARRSRSLLCLACVSEVGDAAVGGGA